VSVTVPVECPPPPKPAPPANNNPPDKPNPPTPNKPDPQKPGQGDNGKPGDNSGKPGDNGKGDDGKGGDNGKPGDNNGKPGQGPGKHAAFAVKVDTRRPATGPGCTATKVITGHQAIRYHFDGDSFEIELIMTDPATGTEVATFDGISTSSQKVITFYGPCDTH